MAPHLVIAVLLLALSTSCSTPRVVRLDTGQGRPLEYRPPTSHSSVQVSAAAFEDALAQLLLDVPLTLRPPPQGQMVRVSHPGNEDVTRWQRLMSKSYGGLCNPGQRRSDCLSLLDDVMGLREWEKLGVALGLSIDPLKESISSAVERTLYPQLCYTVLATGLVTWVALRQLKWAADRATVWEELQQASYRFANRVGPEVARVVVLAVTVVVSYGIVGTSASLASRLSMLPRFAEATAASASRVGVNLANVGEIHSVAVSANGTITLGLAPAAVASVTHSPSGGTNAKEASGGGKVPNPHGSRGGPEHRAAVERRIEELRAQGHEHLSGGSRPEEVIPTPGGCKTCRRPDITTRAPDGTIHRENVGRTTKSGEPVARERKTLDDIEGATGSRPAYTPYDR